MVSAGCHVISAASGVMDARYNVISAGGDLTSPRPEVVHAAYEVRGLPPRALDIASGRLVCLSDALDASAGCSREACAAVLVLTLQALPVSFGSSGRCGTSRCAASSRWARSGPSASTRRAHGHVPREARREWPVCMGQTVRGRRGSIGRRKRHRRRAHCGGFFKLDRLWRRSAHERERDRGHLRREAQREWEFRLEWDCGQGEPVGKTLAVDGAGNVIVTGAVGSLVAKLDASGNPLWSKNWGCWG